MADQTSSQEKTERATPQRRKQTRERGQVAKSQELNSVIMLGAGLLLMSAFFPYLVQNGGEIMVVFFRISADGGAVEGRFGAMFETVLLRFFKLLAPILVGMVVASLATNVMQVGFHITPKAIEPKLDRINPIEGFKRILGKRGLVELIKGIMKILIVGSIAYATYKSRIGDVVDFMFFLPDQMIPESIKIGASFLIKAITAMAILAILDYSYQKWEFEKSIKMTRQDVKEELKENEGDPLLRSRVRAIQQKMASERMMEGVKGATLVLTNPTHYAVALTYEEEDPAPRVVAKGMNLVARKIKEIAREHGVPIIEKPTLARLLYKECDIGQLIPTVLYEAVAEVLAYVYSLKKKIRR